MIISVSRRTDIPAFFSEWFGEEFKKRRVVVANPYRPGQKREVSLRKGDVDAFVFWTRYPRPFFWCLDAIDNNQIPYYFMMGITHYPVFLEPRMVDLDVQIQALKDLARRIGRSRIIWRYDPIIFSRETDMAFHKSNFQTLATRVAPFAHRVIISFLDSYRKVKNRFNKIGFTPVNIREQPGKLRDLALFLKDTAERNELDIQTCAEDIPRDRFPVKHGKCIDNDLLNSLFGCHIDHEKDPGQRPSCGCQKSVDIGTYGSCGFQCLYCYAL